MYANVTVENIITKGKRYDVKYSERIAPKVSFVGDDGNTHELNARYFGDTKLVRCIVNRIQDIEYNDTCRVSYDKNYGEDMYSLKDNAGNDRFLPKVYFEDVENQEEPIGYVGRFMGQCYGFTHLKIYNIEWVILEGDCVKVRNDKGILTTMRASLFEKLGEVTQEADEIDQRKSTKYRKQIPSGMGYLDVYRVCALFNVQDTTGGIHQAIKKLLAAGNRGYKNREEDLQEAIDAIQEVMKIDKEIE